MSLTIQSFTSEDAFQRLQAEWTELHANSPCKHIFTTWEWQSTWWKAYHPGRLWILAVRGADGRLVGLAPWFIDDYHPKGSYVRSIGCVEVTDYLEIILRAGYEQEALQTLAEYVVEYRSVCYDAVDLCNIPGDSPILERFPPILEAVGFDVEVRQQEVSPAIKLPDDWDSYLKQLDKKNRHEVRRKLRRMMGSGLSYDWYFITPDDDLAAATERFIALMRASHPDKDAFMNDPQNLDFFQRIVPLMAECGWLRMSFLELDGRDAAAYISFDYENRILLYNSGLDPDNHFDLSPGIILLVFIIQNAIEEGREIFDFLRGDEEYKYRLGGIDTPVMLIHAR